MSRIGLAFRCFFRILTGKPLPDEALPITVKEQPPLLPEPTIETQAAKDTPAVQLLALLQKEGRLIDFLQEDIDSYSDAQVGSAVRNIHQSCRQVLKEHVGLEPVLPGAEESRVSIESGFDPSRIRLIGNVMGEPPFSGVLKHHGWRATAISLSSPPANHDPSVIFPAEVELG